MESLTVRDFRNIRSFSHSNLNVVNVITGRNGEGKTNLLESIYALLKAESFRPYCDNSDWLPHNNSAAKSHVSGKLRNRSGFSIDVQLDHKSSSVWESSVGPKKLNKRRLADFFPIVAFSPDDHQLLRGSPELRRGFFDQVFCDVAPGYREASGRFDQTLRHRNTLLKTFQKQGVRGTNEEFRTWDQIYINEANELWNQRSELWPEFSERFRSVTNKILRTNGMLELVYQTEWRRRNIGASSVDSIKQELEDDFQVDLKRGYTSFGPHRDDFEIRHGDFEGYRGFASQGQARILALALKWVHAEWVKFARDEKPIMLLDDFSSELDTDHRIQLLKEIAREFGQLFLTTTERSFVDSMPISDYTHLVLQDGQISYGFQNPTTI